MMVKDTDGVGNYRDLLDKVNFTHPESAGAAFERLFARHPRELDHLLPFLSNNLATSADPDRALTHFERLLENGGSWLLGYLVDNPRLIEILITLFSTSPFLTEILLAAPESIELLNQRSVLTERKTVDQYLNEALAVSQQPSDEQENLNRMRRYQRGQLLRIGAADFLDLFDLRAVISQLSRMAIGLVRACLALAAEQTGVNPAGFTVLAMGKLGGRELNYSSDIDLLFVSRDDPLKYTLLARALIESISKTTAEGFLYRVDMRLRPWGHDGPLVSSLESQVAYYQSHAKLWEKQAFLKARPIAGNLALGDEFRAEVEPFLFGIPSAEVRADIFTMKQRTEEFLAEKGRQWGEVKLGRGSIRDIEFVVQSLQLTHPAIRTRATLKAIPMLRDAGLITLAEARTLSEGYTFLRATEHYLQITDYQQTYTLPTEPSALNLLARRLGFEGESAGARFIQAYETHCQAIRAVFLKVVGNQVVESGVLTPEESQKMRAHVARMDVSYSTVFTAEEIARHTHLTEVLTYEKPVIVETHPLGDDHWRVTVVGFDYLGELSLICGLLFVHGLDILESQVFTYESTGSELASLPNGTANRQKIVDVFTVKPATGKTIDHELWMRYADELLNLIQKMQTGKRREAQVELAKRVGSIFQELPSDGVPLLPIDITIENTEADRYTILRISASDTVGFVYEFSNALALSHINIVRMSVKTVGNRAEDTLYVTDEKGGKIIDPEKQRELRAATVLIKHFTHLLPYSPNPESALLHFREFLHQLFERPNWVDEFASLERPEVLNALARLLGVSDFLWDDFLRMQYSNLFPIVRDVNALEEGFDKHKLERDLETTLVRASDPREALNAFKDKQIFRIDMRHILGYTSEFWDFSAELTDLVEVIFASANRICFQELVSKYGSPTLENGERCRCTILALGKCGGRELGFASDIEVMFVYEGQGKTLGLKSVPNSQFFEEWVRMIEKTIQARQEGTFHLDLQLRPYGKAGSLAVALDSFKKYYSPDGPAWPYERQSLVKMRPIVGDAVFGEILTGLRDDFIYSGTPFDITAMRAMRERQVRHLTTAGTFNAKFSPGGLVDLEYLVQGLQIDHGAADITVRNTNIRAAMTALHNGGYLSTLDFDRLRKAHTFLRWLIDSLRVVRGNARDVNIPAQQSDEFAYLARRLKYGGDVERLSLDLIRYPQDVLDLSLKLYPIS